VTRVAVFAAVVAAAFAAAFGLGRVFDDGEPAAAPAEQAHAEESHGPEAADAPVPAGLAVAAGGFRLALDDASLAAGRQTLSFRIVDEDGSPVRSFDVLHERPMHVIVVRRDLSAFQHVHPELGSDGRWRVEVDIQPGVHRVFADFQSRGARAVLGADLFGGRGAPAQPLPEPEHLAHVGEYEVELALPEHAHGDLMFAEGVPTSLAFLVRRAGGEVVPEPYLGARGHLVVLREGDLAYIHAHPDEDAAAAEFETTFPSAGRYRAYLQFAHGGRVRTAEFTLEAA
jgi:hypothetical protein